MKSKYTTLSLNIALILVLIFVVSCIPEDKHENGRNFENMTAFRNMTAEEIQRLKRGMNYVYYLSPKEIEELALKAEKGDKEAAFKIYEHYSWAQYDEEKAQYWVKKAAENGHVKAQYHLGFYYLKLYHNKEQGIYWLKKAAENGNDKAKEELRKLGQ